MEPIYIVYDHSKEESNILGAFKYRADAVKCLEENLMDYLDDLERDQDHEEVAKLRKMINRVKAKESNTVKLVEYDCISIEEITPK